MNKRQRKKMDKRLEICLAYNSPCTDYRGLRECTRLYYEDCKRWESENGIHDNRKRKWRTIRKLYRDRWKRRNKDVEIG